jgi:phosphate transport system substrate-binding protein
VIVQKLEINKDALGVFGYSFLEENAAKLRGVDLEAAEPTFENIASGKYKGARRMYVYFKKQHFGVIPGLDKFLAQYVSEKTLGQDGTLARKGLVSLPKAELEAVRKSALAGETMKLDALTN